MENRGRKNKQKGKSPKDIKLIRLPYIRASRQFKIPRDEILVSGNTWQVLLFYKI